MKAQAMHGANSTSTQAEERATYEEQKQVKEDSQPTQEVHPP